MHASYVQSIWHFCAFMKKLHSFPNVLQVAARPEVEELLKEWDIAETERLLVSLEKEKEKRKEMESHLWKNEESKSAASFSHHFYSTCSPFMVYMYIIHVL